MKIFKVSFLLGLIKYIFNKISKFQNINSREFIKNQKLRLDFFINFQEKYSKIKQKTIFLSNLEELLNRNSQSQVFINLRGEFLERKDFWVDYQGFKNDCHKIENIIREFGGLNEFMDLMVDEKREELDSIKKRIQV